MRNCVEVLLSEQNRHDEAQQTEKHHEPNSKPWEIVSMPVILTISVQPRLVKLGFPSLLHWVRRLYLHS
jgi:hypothetical protein